MRFGAAGRILRSGAGSDLGFLKGLFIVALAGAISAGAVALIERLVLEPPRPTVSGEPPPLPIVKKKPVRQWKWRLT